MSRIISFRVWDKYEKKYLLPEKQDFVILPTRPSFGVTIPYQSKYYMDENIDIDCVDWADADLIMGRYELEQDTGLKDKNGKKIYENDIVCFGNVDFPMVVVWHKTAFRLKNNVGIGCPIAELESCEVLGNMNENSELINYTLLSGEEE